MKSNKYLFSGILVIAVLGLGLYHRHEVITALSSISVPWAAAGFLCIFVNYLFRALRLNLLTEKKLQVWPQGIYCASVHGFATYMLPMRSGDLSLPFLLKSLLWMDLKDGAAVLYKARLLEVFTLGIWLVLVSFFPSATLTSSIRAVMMITGTLMVLSPFLLRIVLKLSYFPVEKLQRIAMAFKEKSELHLHETMLTCGIWLSIAVGVWCISASMQLSLDASDVAILIALQLLMQLVPVQGFANSGNHESGWVAALVLIGYPTDVALKFALTSHAIILVYVLLLGMIGLILRHITMNTVKKPS
jgi:hypothetical protein